MSNLLDMLGKGLDANVGETLERHLRVGSGQSIDQLRRRCRLEGDRPELHRRLGLAYLHGMQFSEAVEHLRRACRDRPDDLPTRVALAATYDEMGQPEKALEQLRVANQVQPGAVAVLFAIGYCLEKLSRPDEAREYYRDVLAAEASHVAARHRLAAIALLTDDLPEAVTQYEQLRAMDGGSASVRSVLAHLYHRAGRHAEAIA